VVNGVFPTALLSICLDLYMLLLVSPWLKVLYAQMESDPLKLSSQRA